MNTKRKSPGGLPILPKSLKFSSQIALIAFALILACEEEEQKVQPQIIQFTSTELFLTEGASTTISLPFGASAPNDGSVEIFLGNNAIYGQHYVTIPAATANTVVLTILRGQRFIQFQVITFDDTEVNPSRTVAVSLQRPSAGFRLGSQYMLNVNISDNEQAVPEPPQSSQIFANIDLQRISVTESESSGISVRVSLSRLIEDEWGYGSVSVPTTATGSVTVKFASGHASYGNDFTTLPLATNDSLLINFTGTQTDTTFTFIPIDNGNFKGSRFISVQISGATGEIQASSGLYWLEIEDDEGGPNQIKWTKLQNIPVTVLMSAKFHDENNGYIWGQNQLYKTTDGGMHWDELKTDPSKAYTQITPFFIDDNVGFVSALEYECDYYGYSCITNSTIFKTTDGGSKWTPLKVLDTFVSSLYFLSESIGFIGTTNGEILKTVDGGENWDRAVGPIYGVPVSDFIFFGNGTGYARSYHTILKTVDSGDSWIASFTAPREAGEITSLAGSSTNSLYALLQGCPNLPPNAFRTIYKSDDGTNWTSANECALAERLSLSLTGTLGISVGRILHQEWQSAVLLTQNNGSSWIQQSTPSEAGSLSHVAIASDNVIYAFGDGGLILKGEVE